MIELTVEEKKFLKALSENKVRFMIVGLSSAVLQNAHVVTHDIGLWIEDLGSEKFKQAVTSVGGFYIPPGIAGMNPPMLGPGSLKIFDLVINMHGLESFAEEYKNSISVNLSGVEVRILPLERIIVSKTAADREKDRAVLPILKAALAVNE